MKFTLSPTAQPRVRVLVAALAALVAFGPTPIFAADTVVVETRDVAIGFPAEATVEAVRQAIVAAQISGRVLDIRVDAGQRVKQGEVLMRIDAREAAGGDAAAQANLVQARASFERTKNLHTQKFVSKAALDQAEAAYKAAQGSASASGATYSHATVTAPIAGIIAERLVQVGEMAAPGTPLVTVFDPKGLRVIASIPQSRLAAVKRAGEARVEFPEINLSVPARRIEVLPAVDAKSHTATARLYLPDNIEGIVPGMAARVHFATGQAKKLTVPLAAVVRRGEITAVYILDGKGAGSLRQVRLGELAANGEMDVLAGINSGERVSLDPIKTGIAVHALRAQGSGKP
jgi:RND family efflux transporter MFP subunit